MAGNLPVPSPSSHVAADHPQRSFSSSSTQDRPQWAGANPNYGYMVDPGHQAGSYAPQARQVQYQGQPQASQYQSMQPILPAPPQGHTGYSAPIVTPHAEFQGLSMQSSGSNPPQAGQAMHEHQGAQASYSVQQGYNAPPTSTAYAPPPIAPTQQMPMDYHPPPGQPQYQYGSYHGPG